LKSVRPKSYILIYGYIGMPDQTIKPINRFANFSSLVEGILELTNESFSFR